MTHASACSWRAIIYLELNFHLLVRVVVIFETVCFVRFLNISLPCPVLSRCDSGCRLQLTLEIMLHDEVFILNNLEVDTHLSTRSYRSHHQRTTGPAMFETVSVDAL